MGSRQPIQSQQSANSDVVTNNNVEQVIGILGTRINSPTPPTFTGLYAMLVLSPNNGQWDLLNTIPTDVLPFIPASLQAQNEIQFNYMNQGGF